MGYNHSWHYCEHMFILWFHSTDTWQYANHGGVPMMDNGMHPEKTIIVACLICIYIYRDENSFKKGSIYIHLRQSLLQRK